jgi:hypothetical protein
MKAEKIIRLLWRGEVYETRSVLFIDMDGETQNEFKLSWQFHYFNETFKGVEFIGNKLRILVKVFHDNPWHTRATAYMILAAVRWLRNRRAPVRIATMHYRHREPKRLHWTHNHFTHRRIR